MTMQGKGNVYSLTDHWYNWEIPSFSVLSQEGDSRIWSPFFIYNYMTYKIIKPGWKVLPETNSLGIIFSSTDESMPPVKSIKVGMADMKNVDVSCCNGEWIERNNHFTVLNLVSLQLFKVNYKLLRNNKLRFRLFCDVLNSQAFSGTDEVSVRNVATTKVEDNMVHTSKPDEEECSDSKSSERLIQNFKDLFLGGKYSDIIIQVKDREFKAHKAIITARSSVFDRMFSHDFSETNSNVIPIDDCEPEVFEEFLLFVYTGRTRHLSSENVCGLYYLADKYDLPELKKDCVNFLRKCLAVQTVCDVICLSANHNETGLLENATVFFARNLEEILVTDKWQVFMRENPTEANELYLKALKLGFTKRNI